MEWLTYSTGEKEIYFDAKAGDKYVHEEIGFSSYFLEFQDGARLELMYNTEMDDVEKYRKRTGFIHIAFTVGRKEDVDRITEKIKKDGYEKVCCLTKRHQCKRKKQSTNGRIKERL